MSLETSGLLVMFAATIFMVVLKGQSFPMLILSSAIFKAMKTQILCVSSFLAKQEVHDH